LQKRKKNFVAVFFLQRILKRIIKNASEIKAHRRRFSFPEARKISHGDFSARAQADVSIGVLWIARLSTSRKAMGLSAILVIHSCG
jgi:hypothetical protein